MDTNLAESINTFGIAPKADFVPPADSIISASQLRGILEAIQGLQDEVAQLHAERDQDRQEIAALRARIATVESLQEQDVTRLACDIAYDRQRLAALERVEPQPLQKDRAEILRALLVTNGGKMLAKDARQKMHLSRSAFSQLIATMRDDIELKQFHLKKNHKVIILKSCLAKQ